MKQHVRGKPFPKGQSGNPSGRRYAGHNTDTGPHCTRTKGAQCHIHYAAHEGSRGRCGGHERNSSGCSRERSHISEASELARLVDTFVKVLEANELAQRLSAVEQQLAAGCAPERC